MSTTALTTRPPVGLDTSSMNVMELGQVLARSGYFKDARDASQAVVKVLYGQEIGIGPVSAMMGVHIIEGKPAPSANLIAARIKGSGRYDYRVREHSREKCRVEFFQRNREGWESLGWVEWTIQDARDAGLTGRGPWKSYPRAMLFARAISEGARVHCPELFGGAPVYTPDELGADVDAEGNAIIVDAQVISSAPSATAQPERNLPTTRQAEFIRKMIQSSVFNDEERAAIEDRIETGFKGEVSAAIDGIKAQLDARKAAEAKKEREYVAELAADSDPDDDNLDNIFGADPEPDDEEEVSAAGDPLLEAALGMSIRTDTEGNATDVQITKIRDLAAEIYGAGTPKHVAVMKVAENPGLTRAQAGKLVSTATDLVARDALVDDGGLLPLGVDR